MEQVVGDEAIQMIIRINGDEYEVATAKQAAKAMGYSQEYTCRMCDEGKLLSHKVGGVWWVQIWQYDFQSKV